MVRTSSEIRQLKIDFIKSKTPDIMGIDPHKDFMRMHKIKRELEESGLYKNKKVDENSVLTLVLQAQGKSWRRPFISKR